ncbi:anti-sigma factor [Spongiivirga sp. MCCC 1A20706]|uniref:anti-sigma factor n=1 Tax=Spongiivirga sp. MCCC 1A20706 TaxID=3160963 RepID=UPI003977C050
MKKKINLEEEGILEQYVLGGLSKDEMSQIQRLLSENEELQTKVEQLEKDLERLAVENAIEPSSIVKTKLLRSIEAKKSKERYNLTLQKKSYYLPLAASIACIAIALAGYLFTQWQSAKKQLLEVENETVVLTDRLNEVQNLLEQTEQRYNVVNNSKVIPLRLVGNQKMPQAVALVYLNHEAMEVVINSQGMPKLPKDKDYQLWADVNGEMINMGVVPAEQQLVKMKYISDASSINITIEPAGGNDHATVEQLVSNIIL